MTGSVKFGLFLDQEQIDDTEMAEYSWRLEVSPEKRILNMAFSGLTYERHEQSLVLYMYQQEAPC